MNNQWFTSGHEFFNEAICEKVRNKNFNLTAFARQYYYIDKKGNAYAIGHADQRATLGNRKYLMPIIYDRSNIYVAPNKIFYTTANTDHLRGRTFLRQWGMKNMGTYELTSDDKKELTSILPNFLLKTLNKWMKNKGSAQQHENEILFYPFTNYGSFGQPGYPVLSFQATQKYKE